MSSARLSRSLCAKALSNSSLPSLQDTWASQAGLWGGRTRRGHFSAQREDLSFSQPNTELGKSWWNLALEILVYLFVPAAIKSTSPWHPSSFQLKKTIATIYLAALTIASSSSKTTWLPGILQDKFFTTVCFFLHCCLQRLKKLLPLQRLRLVLLHSFELWITGYTLYLHMPLWEKSIWVLKSSNWCCRRSVHISSCCRALASWRGFNKTWHRYGAKLLTLMLRDLLKKLHSKSEYCEDVQGAAAAVNTSTFFTILAQKA